MGLEAMDVDAVTSLEGNLTIFTIVMTHMCPALNIDLFYLILFRKLIHLS